MGCLRPALERGLGDEEDALPVLEDHPGPREEPRPDRGRRTFERELDRHLPRRPLGGGKDPGDPGGHRDVREGVDPDRGLVPGLQVDDVQLGHRDAKQQARAGRQLDERRARRGEVSHLHAPREDDPVHGRRDPREGGPGPQEVGPRLRHRLGGPDRVGLRRRDEAVPLERLRAPRLGAGVEEPRLRLRELGPDPPVVELDDEVPRGDPVPLADGDGRDDALLLGRDDDPGRRLERPDDRGGEDHVLGNEADRPDLGRRGGGRGRAGPRSAAGLEGHGSDQHEQKGLAGHQASAPRLAAHETDAARPRRPDRLAGRPGAVEGARPRRGRALRPPTVGLSPPARTAAP